MSNNFTVDQLAKSEALDPNSLNRLYKLNLLCKCMKVNSNEPSLTQKRISNQIGFSVSTFKKI